MLRYLLIPGVNFLELLGSAVIVCTAIFGSYYLTWRILIGAQWRRAPSFPSDPIPAGWDEIVERSVPLASRLTGPEREKLLRLIQVFLRTKLIEGCDGLEVTEEMRVIIAAQACLLLLHLDAGCYPGLRTVLVYPGTYRPRGLT